MNCRHFKWISVAQNRRAFSLLELLVVIGIMAAIFAIAVPVMTDLGGSQALVKAAYSIQGALEEARTYAVANNTYTWVGFFEESPQEPAVAGIGRIVICSVASKDGSSIYNKKLAEAGTPSVQTLGASKLSLIGKVVRLDGVHIFNASQQKIGTRPAGLIDQKYLVGLTSQTLIFYFTYSKAGRAKYVFGKRPVATSNGLPSANGIVQFNPRGEAMVDGGPINTPVPNLEIAICKSHGVYVDPGKDVVALDINGLTGQTIVHQP